MTLGGGRHSIKTPFESKSETSLRWRVRGIEIGGGEVEGENREGKREEGCQTISNMVA